MFIIAKCSESEAQTLIAGLNDEGIDYTHKIKASFERWGEDVDDLKTSCYLMHIIKFQYNGRIV